MDILTGAGRIELPGACDECAMTRLVNENPSAAIGAVTVAYSLTYAGMIAKEEGRPFRLTDEEARITYLTTPPGAEAALTCAQEQMRGSCIVYRAIANRVKLEL